MRARGWIDDTGSVVTEHHIVAGASRVTRSAVRRSMEGWPSGCAIAGGDLGALATAGALAIAGALAWPLARRRRAC